MADENGGLSDAEEYRILVELLQKQHVRYNDFCRIGLTANTILVGFVGLMLTAARWQSVTPYVLVAMAVVGFLICVVWMLTLYRLELDDERLFLQLRG